eukprot:6040057-Prymnesium_polylepis.1
MADDDSLMADGDSLMADDDSLIAEDPRPQYKGTDLIGSLLQLAWTSAVSLTTLLFNFIIKSVVTAVTKYEGQDTET